MDEQELQTTTENRQSPTDYLWIASCVIITAIASFLRFFQLELRPLHHDEGVNGYFLTTLFREGKYQYDPANYHGPDLYYLALALTKAFGLNTLSIRGSVAIFGVLTIVLAFFLKKYIGQTGSLCAAFLLALSPGMTYISRYFIHEILFVFLSLGIVVSILFFIEKRQAGIGAIIWTSLLLLVCFLPSALNLAEVLGSDNETIVWILRAAFFLIEAALVFFVMRMLLGWRGGQPIYLILASTCAVLLFATKETAFITIGTMVIACAAVWLWRKIDSFSDFARNKFGFFMSLNVVGLIITTALNHQIREGLKAIKDNFEAANDSTLPVILYAIFALIAVAAIAWLTFLFVNRQIVETDSETDSKIDSEADSNLIWTRFREKTAASGNWEFVLIKSAFLGAAILFVWFFVRCVIEWLAESKVPKTVAVSGINLTSIDAYIIFAGIACLVFAAAIWFLRKPEKISTDYVLMTAIVLIVFLYVGALFFSSFFTYPEGLQKAFEAYAIWTKTGTKDHTQNGIWAYLRWGMIIESPIFILSALGTLMAMFKARHRLAMFAGFWAYGLFAAYTIIPYKTPWLALSFHLPMCIVAGYAVNELLASKNIAEKITGGIAAILAFIILGYQTYDINFVRYDDDHMPYVYAHTRREFLDLIKQIEYYADKSGAGKDAKIEIVSPDYWPMPWYMNDYPNAIFQGKIVDVNSSEMIVAKKDEQDAEIIERYAARYRYVGTYPLRPGVDLVLLVRKDLADSDSQDVYKVFGEPVTVEP